MNEVAKEIIGELAGIPINGSLEQEIKLMDFIAMNLSTICCFAIVERIQHSDGQRFKNSNIEGQVKRQALTIGQLNDF